MKKICSLLFCVLVALALKAQTATAPSAGDGSLGNPYQIATIENLYWIADQANNNSNTFANKFFIQTTDIDVSSTSTWFSGAGWTPISGASTDFFGSYDGQEHRISGLHINRPSVDCVGLFGSAGKGTIKNLGLTNVSITGHANVGGLIGYLWNTGTVSNCYTTGSVSVLYQNGGGLVGTDDGIYGTDNNTISQCYSSCTVSGVDLTGGLIGSATSSTATFGTITGCYAAGSVTSSGVYTGGLIGSTGAIGTVSNCHSTNSVTTSGTICAGGLIGLSGSGTVNNCYATGAVTCTSTNSSDFGGLIGIASSGGTVSNSHAAGAVTAGTSYVSGSGLFGKDIGGLIGTNSGSVSGCFATGATYGGNYVGGLIGYNEGTVSDCYSTGTATDNGYIGFVSGLIGRNQSTVSKCYTISSVSTAGTSSGFAGMNTGTINNNCFWNTAINAIGFQNNSGTFSAAGKTTAEMKTTTTYSSAGWSTGIWSLVTGYYPAFTSLLAAPTITTQAVSSITSTSASGNGNITSLGYPNPEAYGICWDTTGTPTTSKSKVDIGAATATGAFTANLTSLTPNTPYYVRAFATNSSGTSYGSEVTFTTTSTPIWNGTTWSPSSPTSADSAILDGNYNGAGFTCMGLTVNAGKQVTIASGITLTVNGNLTLNSDASSGTATLINNGTLNVVGTTSVKQYLTGKTGGATTDNWWYISSPVTGATSAVFDDFTGTNKFGYYNEASNPPAYVQIANNTTTLTLGTGYVVKLGGASATYTFNGNLNNGNIPVTVTRTGTSAAKRGFNLVGNPYLSYVDWNALKTAAVVNTNIRPSIWYRTRTSGGEMTFDTFDGSTGTNNGINGLVSQYIPPMQAFWMKVDADASSATLTFTNSMRSHRDQSSLTNRLRTTDQTQIVRLKVSNGINSDAAIIVTDQSGSDLFDKYDAQKMSNENVNIPEIYTMAGSEELVINHLNAICEKKELSLGFRPGKSGNFTIEATEITNLDSNLKVMLLDKLINVEKELTVGIPYSFASDATCTNDRFSIRFQSASISTGLSKAENSETIFVYRNLNNQITVVCNAVNAASSVTVYNAVGQKLAQQKLTNTTTVLDAVFNPGIYMVTISNVGQSVTKKVMIK